MSRRALAALVAGLLAACSATDTSGQAHILGAHQMALTSRYLFVTSTDGNELRVLDLSPLNLVTRDFVKAPNPLEKLSIPVIDRPTMLAVDESYDAGVRAAGPYVYASRSGGEEISVVSTSDDGSIGFREVRRLTVPAPVTASAAWGDATQDSRLYFTTFDGAVGTLFAIDLPADPSELHQLSQAQVFARLRLVSTLGPDAPVALLVVPPIAGRTLDGQPFCAGANECLVIATRRTAGSEGRTFMLDPASGLVVPLAFSGPVRFLTTHGGAFLTRAQRGLEPGQRVFALLDEERCGGPQCGGVLAVETLTATSPEGFGQALDAVGQPMVPITLGESLATGLVVGAGAQLLLPGALTEDGNPGLATFDALGVVLASNGNLVFFDAGLLRELDNNSSGPTLNSVTFLNPDGTVGTWVNGPIISTTDPDGNEITAIWLADGAWRSQQLVVTWEGTVRGLTLLPTSAADGAHLPIPRELKGRVLPQDLVVFATNDGDCGTTTVTLVNDASLDVAEVPAECAARNRFTIRAGPQAPFVVDSTLTGFLGRGAPGGHFEYRGAYVFRPDTFDPAAPSVAFDFGTDTDATPVALGSSWVIDVNAQFDPFAVAIDQINIGCAGAQVPASAVFDVARQRVFTAFTPVNGVVEVNPASIARGTIGLTNDTHCYR